MSKWPCDALIAMAEGREAVLVRQLTAITKDKGSAVKMLLRGLLHRAEDTDPDAFEEPRREKA